MYVHPKLSSDSRGCKQPRYSCSIAHLSGSESDSRHSAKIVLQAVNPPYWWKLTSHPIRPSLKVALSLRLCMYTPQCRSCFDFELFC